MNNYAELMANLAGYFPSIPPHNFARFPVMPDKIGERELPGGLTKADFNYLSDAGTLFYYDKALVSAGLVLGPMSDRFPREMMVDRKNRLLETTVFWDSAGFQLLRDLVIWQGDITVRSILRACDYFADITPTIDIPPLKLSKQFDTYEKCRDTSMANNRYYAEHRKGGPKPIILTVLHGTNRRECDDWYKHARVFPFEGWAFGTLYKRSLSELLYRIRVICDEMMMEGRSHLHLFGTNRLALTCALTTIQTVLTRLLGRKITVTYDTSSPFTNSYRSRLAYQGYNIDRTGLAMRQHRFPNGDRSVDWEQLQFPTIFPSAIANRLKLSDICLTTKSIFANSSWDNLSYHMIADHNVEVLLNAIIGVHRIHLMDEVNAAALCPDWLIRTRIGIEEVLTGQNPMTALAKYKSDFDMVRSGGRCMGSDDYEDYADANRG